METDVNVFVVHKEKEWFEHNVLPGFWDSVINEVKEALELVEGESPTVLVFSSPKTDAVKGIVSRKGTLIDRINLTIKVGRSTHMIKLEEPNTLRLDQILNLVNYLRYLLYVLLRIKESTGRAIQQLEEILRAIVFLLNTEEAESKSSVPDLVSQASNISMQPSSSQSLPSTFSNPSSSYSHPPSHVHKTAANNLFTPPLPPNLALSFSVSTSSVCLHLFRLFGSNSILDSLKSSSLDTSKILPYTSQRIDAFSQDPILLAVTAKLSALQKKVNDISYRLKVVESSVDLNGSA
ncbi:RAVE complex subunit Rav2 [Schizosaccharomyces cryophilus OY26]|uniref:RAVE complex subunit Rav2 n=1 Tax=Schizosaccharomyces cryophilus (strain OY26 / ATCC MYA-4695 / CBS 11777 / NBRC 106824 / NRRL Y48691) TaxID=653667 RepID=S9W4R5_SCHCR|nr:RAVE complex subunit Rav2 [Schizosaccharomyces cryophilus OY26]EPY52905.1 RAVE complex subunit Rav2 [Schizosaccharomyces cryophilus OY26]